jgi:hypothetical protein
MADDADTPAPHEATLAEIAREEFGVTARAFFAPVIGAVDVIGALCRMNLPEDAPKPAPVDPSKKRAA